MDFLLEDPTRKEGCNPFGFQGDLDLISQHLVRELPTHSSCCISEQKCNATLLLHRPQLSFPIWLCAPWFFNYSQGEEASTMMVVVWTFSTKHKAVTVLTPLHSEYLLHVSRKRNLHELDNRLEAKIDYLLHVSSNIRSDKGWWQRRWSRKVRQNADTSDNNYKD
jgi:hypothetical protein